MNQKPEDVDQGAWDAACKVSDPYMFNTEAIARAIMAAVAEEREACAKVAEMKFLPGRYGLSGPFPENIARAIRSRAEEAMP